MAKATGESVQLLKGTLDLIVLKTLSWGPMHGYAIATWLESQSGGALGVDDSALYQALHRLEARQLVEAEWGTTSTNRQARFYRLTPAGRRHLKAETAGWLRYADSVRTVLTATGR